MQKIVFFDTETTGLSADDRLCQVAYKYDGIEHVSYFKPPVPIDPFATAVTGITDDTVKDAEVFIGSSMHGEIAVLAEDANVVFVAHNAAFDIGMIAKEGIAITRHIDTLKVARTLDTDEAAENYKQEYLKDFYALDVEEAKAHDALGDVRVLEKMYEKLAELLLAGEIESSDTVSEMMRLTEMPMLFRRMPFGKHKGKMIADLAEEEPGYLEWLLSAKKGSGDAQDRDWIYTLEHHLGKASSVPLA